MTTETAAERRARESTLLQDVDFNAVAREVNSQVARYCNGRKRRDVLEDDLRGVAWVVALEAAEGYNPARGPIGPYVGEILRRQLANYMIVTGAPASGSIRHARDALCAMRSTAILADREKDADGAPAPGVVVEEPASWADEVLADAGWHARVSARIRKVVGDEGAEGLAVLLGEAQPKSYTRRLRESMSAARERIARDGWLAAYWGASDHERLVAYRITLRDLLPGVLSRCGGQAALEDLAATALRLGIACDDMRAEYRRDRRGERRTTEDRESGVLAMLRPDVADPEAHLVLCVAVKEMLPGDEPEETYASASRLLRLGVTAPLFRKFTSGPSGLRDAMALLGEAQK
jgi:hypothetical protein